MRNKNKQKGFLKIFLIIFIGLIFVFFYKTSDGKTYYEKIYEIIMNKKNEVESKVNDAKELMQDRDKEIEKYLE